ncbi:hypothetical protein E2C01_069519 [Portunus trituberculatus]|uniref:Uncharacterized protein n=1 Tax=Portunus trituberculatus TaxID=210409 RepID=A0A5B7I312_PORTR|nr:hypothetical protein [Portunus trituberculatus]
MGNHEGGATRAGHEDRYISRWENYRHYKLGWTDTPAAEESREDTARPNESVGQSDSFISPLITSPSWRLARGDGGRGGGGG